MTDTTFDNFGLPAKLMQALARHKFTTPTPIQTQTIPIALKGKDVLGSAQTGTGKTAAFGIPVIAGLMEHPDAAALIMTPTRELATQVLAALEHIIPTADIRTALLIGGDPMPRQMNQLRHNPRLIVGTPGRINDHLERGSVKLDNVRYLVLDETDRMLDMGFGIQIERILKHVPDERQTLLFSATLPSNITKLSSKYMRDPIRVAVGSTTNAAANIKQEVIPTTDAEKYGKLVAQLDSRKGSVIIFVKTKYGTEKLADKLNRDQHKSDAIHGDLQQRRRERVIQNFRDKKYRILVATDVAARGLDIPHIAHVINYDMPQAPEDYIHRIGRTARAGAEGEAISFLTAADNVKWRAIQRLMSGDNSSEPAQRRGGSARKGFGSGGRKPFWKKEGDRPRGDRAANDRSSGERHKGERSLSDRPRSDKPKSDHPYSAERHKSEGTHSDGHKAYGDRSHGDKPRGDRVANDRPRAEGHSAERHKGERSFGDRPRSDKPRGERTRSEGSKAERFGGDRPRREKAKSEWTPNHRPRGDRYSDDKPRDERGRSEGRDAEGHKGERVHRNRWNSDGPKGGRPRRDRPHGDKSRSDGHKSPRAHEDKPFGDKEHKKKQFSGKSFSGKPAYGKSFSGPKKASFKSGGHASVAKKG